MTQKYDVTGNQKVVLDGHKLAYHMDRVNDWINGKRIAPITIDMALTRACNFNCVYCYGQLQENTRKKLSKDILFRFIEDVADIGVKAISLISDGESSCSPHFYDFIDYAFEHGLDVGVATNGALLDTDRIESVLEKLTYLRFNISAGEPDRYAEIMGCKREDYYKVCDIIRKCAQVKKKKRIETTIGLQMVLMPEFKDQIIPLAKLGKELNADYLVIKHCSDDELHSLGLDYTKYHELVGILKQAEAYSTSDFLVKVKWSKVLSGGDREYTQCFGPPFMLQISGSGLVAPCGMFFNERYKKYHIGNIAEQSFKEIWESERYWEVMSYIASSDFNARNDCGCLCLQHKINEFLWDIKKGAIDVEELASPEEKPDHVNFI